MTIALGQKNHSPSLVQLLSEAPSLAVLGLGTVISLFAVGARGDIAIAAWIAPVLLLRFSRMSSPLVAGLVIWLICFLDMAWGAYLNAPSGNLVAPVIFGFVGGTAYALAYILDRIVGIRLGLVGRLLVLPAAFAVGEFVIATFTPFGLLTSTRAVTQAENLPLLQIISIAGPYAISFLIGWFATTVNLLWEAGSLKKVAVPIGIFAASLFIIVLGGTVRIAFAQTPESYASIAGITPSMSVQHTAAELLGGRVPRSLEELDKVPAAKLTAAYGLVLDDLLANTHRAARAGAKIVLWSETAATTTPQGRAAVLDKAAMAARQEGIYLDVTLGEQFSRNQTFLIGPDGKIKWHYMKTHPVFLMEPVPAGKTPVPTLVTPFGTIANIICFDADFPPLARVHTNIMLVPGVDWPQIGRWHTLNMARLRAIENGYALFRMAFNSQSAAFDRYGRVLATQDTTSPVSHIMYAQVPSDGTPTLYNMIGDTFAWACLLGILSAIGLFMFRLLSTRKLPLAAPQYQ